jgi:hypothetical protein
MATPAKTLDVGRMAMGGLGQMLDSVEMVKRAWSSMSLPTSLVPTVDIEELDKRIADLKAVEQWLNLNLSMLRGTVQGLEIQRGTLAAVKAFGATMGGPMRTPEPADPVAAAQQRAAAALEAMERAVSAAAAAPVPVAAPFGGAQSPFAGAGSPPAVTASPSTGPASPSPAERVDVAPPDRRPASQESPGERQPAATGGGAPALPGLDPAAWWAMLQHNFNQVAEAALSGVGLSGDGGAGPGRPPPARKGAAGTAAGGRAKSGGAASKSAPTGKAAKPGKAAAGSRNGGATRGRVKPAGQ